jgi:type I restriction enzyme, S subunit
MGSDWRDVRFEDVIDLQSGFAFKSKDFLDEGELRLARGANISQGSFNWSNTKYLPTDHRDIDDRYRLASGDVLLAMDRPWIPAGLKYAVVRPSDLPALLVQRVARLRARAGQLDQGFLYYLLGSPAFTDYVRSVETGTTIPHISGKQIQGYRVSIPPIEEQRAIAEVLGALDDRIEWCDAGTSLARDLARSVAEQHEADATVRLADVADIRRSTISATKLQGRWWTHYSIPAFDDGQQALVESGSKIRSGKFSVPPNSVLVSKLNPTWPRVWLPATEDDPPAICSTELMPVVPRGSSGATSAALWSALLSPSFNRQLRERVQGSTGSHQRVRPEDMLACRVMNPAALTKSTGGLLASLAARVRDLRVERRSLVSSREALLPRLLSGEVRIEDPARVLGAVA